jgi:S-adenosylmethionine synthetase
MTKHINKSSRDVHCQDDPHPRLSVGQLPPLNGLFTSESVSDGHPDKICDQISDAILDAVLEQQADARVAVETAIKNNQIWVFGEISEGLDVPVAKVAKEILSNIGHENPNWGIDLGKMEVRTTLSRQAPEISTAVDGADKIGAGDQGMMFGFASNERPDYLPTPISLAHGLMRQHRKIRLADNRIGPDAKAQVTVRYEAGVPVSIASIVLSTQHRADTELEKIREIIRTDIIEPVCGSLAEDAELILNPGGSFTLGGPQADAGLTGRKIIVDSYGGLARHGGGAFSGKDGSKVDRSAAYAARQLAISMVAAGLANTCEIRLAYAIGRAEPIALHIDVDEAALQKLTIIDADTLLKLQSPGSIINRLGLNQPIFRETARFGHFGNASYPWERPISLNNIMAGGLS